jgi:hypothetical protein
MTYHHGGIDGCGLLRSSLRSTWPHAMIVFLFLGHLTKPNKNLTPVRAMAVIV